MKISTNWINDYVKIDDVDKKELANENLEALAAGIKNLEKHIENIAKYDLPSVVAINAFPTDSEA